MADRVAEGLAVLRLIEADRLSMKAVVDRLEGVHDDPAAIRATIEAAVDRGLIERDGETVVRADVAAPDPDPEIVRREGSFDCRRCGRGIGEGYFIEDEVRSIGPFGSTCIRKVTGREP